MIVINQEKLQAREDAKALLEADKQRDEAMLTGDTYTLNGKDYQVSFTKDDGDGMVQVQIGFSLGLASTTIHFNCGTKLLITADEFLPFALWFVTERNKFFTEEVVEEVQEEVVV